MSSPTQLRELASVASITIKSISEAAKTQETKLLTHNVANDIEQIADDISLTRIKLSYWQKRWSSKSGLPRADTAIAFWSFRGWEHNLKILGEIVETSKRIETSLGVLRETQKSLSQGRYALNALTSNHYQPDELNDLVHILGVALAGILIPSRDLSRS